MSLLTGLLGNKTLLNSALSGIRNNMKKDGISCIVLRLTDDETGDTPGLDIKSYAGEIGILSGEDLRLANRLYDTSPEDLGMMVSELGSAYDGSDEVAPETWSEFFKSYDLIQMCRKEGKEAENAL